MASRCCPSARSTTRSWWALEPWGLRDLRRRPVDPRRHAVGGLAGPEGGAHQSIVTPSIGIGQPGCTAWEPAFGQDLEWTLLHALSARAPARRVRLLPPLHATARPGAGGRTGEQRRRLVLAGGYRCAGPAGAPRNARGHGGGRPRVLAAADAIGDTVDVICVASADLLLRALRARAGFGAGDDAILRELLPPDRAAPLVTVLDGDPHALAFLGTINSTPLTPLGVTRLASRGLADVYREHEIDTEAVVGAALDLLG